MNKNTIVGWILLLGLMLLWTGYQQRQHSKEQAQKSAQQKTDSLEKAKTLAAAAADSAVRAARTPAQNGALSDSGKAAAASAVAHTMLIVETNRFTVTVDNQGARLAKVTLKELAGHKPLNPDIIQGDGGALTLTVDNQDLTRQLWIPDTKDSVLDARQAPATVHFKLIAPDGKRTLDRSFTFYPDSAKIVQHLESSTPLGSYSLGWNAGLSETENIVHGKGVGLMSGYFSELIYDNGVNVERTAFVGDKVLNAESGVLKWAGLRRKYVAGVINFNHETNNKVVAKGRVAENEDKSYPHDYELLISASNVEDKTLDFDFLILPLSYDQLLAYHQNYEKIIFSGYESFFRADIWYPALCGLVLHTLKFFNGFVHNYGLAIILLTLLVRTLTFPLTIAQTKQGVKMQQHMPAISKIREKHKGNPQKANLEIMEYYKKEGVNPLSGVMGCFPVFLQMPIFISLFNVLGRSVELKGAPFFGWVHDLARPDVVYDALKLPYLFPLGVTILPFFMAASMFFQMKMSVKDPNQKMMVWMMPVMMFVFSCSFPSGLVLYWTVSNLFTIGQTYFYTNRLRPAGAAVVTTPAKPTRNKPAKT
ncbi:MAG: membrane protein insertase YidC [Fibrobacteres bacterium]|nr:membrane protein insertase YidC [Fibrobacterota bacterium]